MASTEMFLTPFVVFRERVMSSAAIAAKSGLGPDAWDQLPDPHGRVLGVFLKQQAVAAGYLTSYQRGDIAFDKDYAAYDAAERAVGAKAFVETFSVRPSGQIVCRARAAANDACARIFATLSLGMAGDTRARESLANLLSSLHRAG